MRLLRLKIRNIASLRGEHEVNFEDIQRHSSLFAITGETGAGKSTILNSIGLALYGQVYKKNVQQIDLVTLGEKDGSIELIFQAGGKTYLADWRARVRKQNGEPYSTPQSPIRILYELEGKEFSGNKKASEKKVDDLLNLDFDQFCKCIILNQGEFARFLTSSFTERKEILEKLYPGEMLESMGRELQIELDVLKKEKNELEIKLGELKIEEDTGEGLLEKKNELRKELDHLEASLISVESLDRHFASLCSYHEKNLINDRKKDDLKLTLKVETSKFNELLKNGEELSQLHQDSLKILDKRLPELQECLKKEEQIRNLSETLFTLGQKEKQLQMERRKLKEKLDDSESELKTLTQAHAEANAKIASTLTDLKSKADDLEPFIDRVSEKELLDKEVAGKSEILKVHELSGKELGLLVKTLEEEHALIPADLPTEETKLQARKQELKLLQEKEARQLVIREEAQKEILRLTDMVSKTKLQLEEEQRKLKTLQTEIIPIETTLGLQEIILARNLCLTHAIETELKTCPVCETPVEKDHLIELRNRLGGADFNEMRKLLDLKKHDQLKTEAIVNALKEKLIADGAAVTEKRKICEAQTEPSFNPAQLEEIDRKLEELRGKIQNKQKLEKDISQRKAELERIRKLYVTAKGELTTIQEKLKVKASQVEALHAGLVSLIPEITPESMREFRLLRQNFLSYLDVERKHQKLLQEKFHIEENQKRIETELHSLASEVDSQTKQRAKLETEVKAIVKDSSAALIIKELTELNRTHSENLRRHLEIQKRQELSLKDSQGRLSQMDELSKDYDLQFTSELHAVRACGDKIPEPLLRFKEIALELNSPSELFSPLSDLIGTEKKLLKEKADTCRMTFSSVSTRLSEWEKRQDKIQLLELKYADNKNALARKNRLYEVLGKDELRTFVLSLVEENLILQTNEELQKLCQGRYEIVHQTRSMKMMPEFYILDKFREGGRRKVSTLSGGETFMVSLAMALGLAEMTRGKAEIDSLFIDEGFGTLDQDSLGDVLDMLQQIQTRGLMVGLISHVKSLTDSLSINLRVNKNSSGNSSIQLVTN